MQGDDRDMLFISGPSGGKEKPAFSSGSTWRDRTDIDRLPAQKKLPAAGIVKMYLGGSDLVGTVDNSLYATLSDNLLDSDSLIVQPLLKKTLGKRGLPAISTNNTGGKLSSSIASISSHNRNTQREQFDVIVGNKLSRSVGTDHVVESRVN